MRGLSERHPNLVHLNLCGCDLGLCLADLTGGGRLSANGGGGARGLQLDLSSRHLPLGVLDLLAIAEQGRRPRLLRLVEIVRGLRLQGRIGGLLVRLRRCLDERVLLLLVEELMVC